MSSLKRQQDFIKDSLAAFIEKHVDGELLSCIDDIVLNYMTSVLEDVGVEASHEEPFNVDDFIEMMGAYFPGFTTVKSSTVCEWLFSLAKQLSEIESSDELHVTNGIHEETKTHESDMTKESCAPGIRKYRENEDVWNSEQEDDEDINVCGVEKQVALLQELFPNVCVLEVSQCLAIAGGDAEQAAQLIMHRMENCESFSPNSLQSVTKLRIRPQDDKQLKEHILERYAYVDQADDQREHKPVAPKTAPKKLVRYRDSKIVSLKGEKYTEVKKDEDEDGMKKTHVSLKPARQYRFH